MFCHFRVVLAVQGVLLGDAGVWRDTSGGYIYGGVVGVSVLCQGPHPVPVCCFHQCC